MLNDVTLIRYKNVKEYCSDLRDTFCILSLMMLTFWITFIQINNFNRNIGFIQKKSKIIKVSILNFKNKKLKQTPYTKKNSFPMVC